MSRRPVTAQQIVDFHLPHTDSFQTMCKNEVFCYKKSQGIKLHNTWRGWTYSLRIASWPFYVHYMSSSVFKLWIIYYDALSIILYRVAYDKGFLVM